MRDKPVGQSCDLSPLCGLVSEVVRPIQPTQIDRATGKSPGNPNGQSMPGHEYWIESGGAAVEENKLPSQFFLSLLPVLLTPSPSPLCLCFPVIFAPLP